MDYQRSKAVLLKRQHSQQSQSSQQQQQHQYQQMKRLNLIQTDGSRQSVEEEYYDCDEDDDDNDNDIAVEMEEEENDKLKNQDGGDDNGDKSGKGGSQSWRNVRAVMAYYLTLRKIKRNG